MQMRAHELQRLTVKELHNLAEKFKVENFSGLRKQDLIREILEKQAKNNEAIYGEGVLEVMSDGYGFLRSPDYSIYLAQTIFMFHTRKLKDLD